MLALLEIVDLVIVFEDKNPLKIIKKISPNFLFKGSDYKLNEVIGKNFVESYGGKVILTPFKKGKKLIRNNKKLKLRNKLIIVTGGLGFIGINLIKSLTESRQEEIIVCDKRKTSKNLNISKLNILNPDNLFDYLNKNKKNLNAIIHLGAVSDTTEKNIDLILNNNYYLSLELWNFCSRFNIKFIYASSAATYGMVSMVLMMTLN